MGVWGKIKDAAGAVYGAGADALGGGKGYTPKAYSYDEERYGQHRDAQGQARDYQTYLAQQYQDQIEGRGPSLAQEQMEAQNAANKRQQLAMARSGAGGALGQAGAMRTAQQMAAQQDLGLQQNAAMLRAQEHAAAMQGMAGLSSDIRGQDQGMLAQEQSYELGKAGVHGSMEAAKAGAHESYMGRRQKGIGAMYGGVSTAATAAMAGSDRAVKEGIKPTSDSDLEDFLEAAKTYWYRYKEGSDWDDGGRLHVGPMANDLQDTKVGRTMVEEDPDGNLMVDTNKAYGAYLAGLGQLAERVDNLEAKKGRK